MRFAVLGLRVLVAAALLACAAWFPLRDDITTARVDGPPDLRVEAGVLPGLRRPRVVASGDVATFAGARWRLVSIRTDVAPRNSLDDTPSEVELPPGTSFVVATVDVRPVDGRRAVRRYGRCQLVLVAADGRRWGDTSRTLPRPTGCGPSPDATEGDAPPGTTYQMSAIVPEEEVASLGLAALFSGQRAAGLLFAPPDGR